MDVFSAGGRALASGAVALVSCAALALVVLEDEAISEPTGGGSVGSLGGGLLSV